MVAEAYYDPGSMTRCTMLKLTLLHLRQRPPNLRREKRIGIEPRPRTK